MYYLSFNIRNRNIELQEEKDEFWTIDKDGHYLERIILTSFALVRTFFTMFLTRLSDILFQFLNLSFISFELVSHITVRRRLNFFNASSSVLPCMSREKLITHIFSMGRLLIFPKDTRNQIFHLYESSWTPVFSITTQFLIFIFRYIYCY